MPNDRMIVQWWGLLVWLPCPELAPTHASTLDLDEPLLLIVAAACSTHITHLVSLLVFGIMSHDWDL